jgi:iron(III) transport system substrate-binding protein
MEQLTYTHVRSLARALCISVLAAAVWAAPAAAQSADPMAAIYEAAKKEGTAVWYTTFPLDEAQPMADIFQKRYPGVKVEIVRGSGTRIVERFETERNANQAIADVLTYSLVDPFPVYKKQKWLMNFEAPEAAKIPGDRKDNGYWYLDGLTLSCILYSPSRVKKDEVPATPMDVVKPHWKGRVGTIPAWATATALEWAYYVETTLGKGHAFAEGIKATKPKFQTAQAELVEQVVRGELDLAYPIGEYNLYRFKKQGADLECAYPTDAAGIPASLRPIAIPDNAPHPNAAKLFLNWRLSDEGQRALQEGVGIRSARADFEPIPGLPPMSSVKPLLLNPEAVRAARDEIINRWRTVVGE